MLLAASGPEMGTTLPLAKILVAQVTVATAAGPAGQEVEVAPLGIPLAALATGLAPHGSHASVSHILVLPEGATRVERVLCP